MFTSYEFPLNDYAVFCVDDTEKLVAVDKKRCREIYEKQIRHNIFRMIPSRFEVEVIPLSEPDWDGKVFRLTEKKYFLAMNRLRPVINETRIEKENGLAA